MNKMNIRILFRFFVATALLWAVACEKPALPGDDAGQGTGSVELPESLNGTPIKAGNNALGIITDAVTGKGIPGVAVSDGYSVAKTDANGVYQFPASRYALCIFMSCPAGYEIPLNANHEPLFYKAGVLKNGVNRLDFQLTPLEESEDNFTLIAVGDPQVSTEAQISRYKSETIQDIVATITSNQRQGKYNNPYAVTLGDIVHDTPNLWDAMAPTMQNVKLSSGEYIPFFQTIGNHDHNAKKSTYNESIEDYIRHYGPVDYSYNRGKVHIVHMDNVAITQSSGSSWDYDAGFTKSQFSWFEKDLAAVDNKEDKMLILCCHIPFRAGSTSGGSNVNKGKYYAEVLELMTQFNEAHIMIGHTHYPQNYIHTSYKTKNGLPIYEHVHGGACGGWWACNLNVDGAPNGYSIYEIEGNHIKNWLAKSVGFEEGYQMRVYNGNQEFTGPKGYTYKWYENSKGGTANISYTGRSFLRNCFVVSIWNDDETNWKVELMHNGETYPLKRTGSSIMDAAVVSYFFNYLNKNTTSWTKGLYHYWYVQSPDGVDPSELTGWTIKATHTMPGNDPVQNVYTRSSLQTDYNGF